MLTEKEKFCKWSLLLILIFSIIAPVSIIQRLDLLRTQYVFDAILFFLLIATSIQGLVGLIGWFLLNRDDERGKKVFVSTYLATLAGYGIYGLYLLVTLIFPDNFAIFPLEIYSIFTLLANSGIILLLQHFWSRDII